MCCNLIPRNLFILIALLGLTLGLGNFVLSQAQADEKEQDAPAQDRGPLGFTVKSITGQDVDLSKYLGNVVLIVNTASKCGNTPQYAPLEQLHEQYAEKGLSILGFPANNFGKQEPGTNEQIQEFCKQNYGVKFDMFAKVSVKGDDITPLYAYLTSEKTNPGFAGDIRWNFDKFLISREGKVVARFAPKAKPDSEEVLKAIKAELEKPAPQAASKSE